MRVPTALEMAIAAKLMERDSNVWDNNTVTDVLNIDVSGSADVDALGSMPVNCSMTVSLDELKRLKIDVYPNPSSGLINVSIEHNMQNTSLSIINLYGQVVYEMLDIDDEQIVLDLSGRANGVYLIRLHKDKILLNSRLLVIN